MGEEGQYKCLWEGHRLLLDRGSRDWIFFPNSKFFSVELVVIGLPPHLEVVDFFARVQDGGPLKEC